MNAKCRPNANQQSGLNPLAVKTVSVVRDSRLQ